MDSESTALRERWDEVMHFRDLEHNVRLFLLPPKWTPHTRHKRAQGVSTSKLIWDNRDVAGMGSIGLNIEHLLLNLKSSHSLFKSVDKQ